MLSNVDLGALIHSQSIPSVEIERRYNCVFTTQYLRAK